MKYVELCEPCFISHEVFECAAEGHAQSAVPDVFLKTQRRLNSIRKESFRTRHTDRRSNDTPFPRGVRTRQKQFLQWLCGSGQGRMCARLYWVRLYLA